MSKQQITTHSGASPVGAYSQGLRVGDFVFVSGQGPLDPTTGRIVGDTVEEQTARVLENIKAILEAGGASLADVQPDEGLPAVHIEVVIDRHRRIEDVRRTTIGIRGRFTNADFQFLGQKVTQAPLD